MEQFFITCIAIAFIMGNAFINQEKYKQIKCLNIRVDSINYFNYICFYNNVSSNVLFIIEFNMITCHGLRKKYIILVNYQSPSVQWLIDHRIFIFLFKNISLIWRCQYYQEMDVKLRPMFVSFCNSSLSL